MTAPMRPKPEAPPNQVIRDRAMVVLCKALLIVIGFAIGAVLVWATTWALQ